MHASAIEMLEIALLATLLSSCLYLIVRLRRSQSLVRQDRDALSATLDIAGALVLVMDRHGRILRFNNACEATTGYRYAEVRGRYPWDFLLPEEAVEPLRSVFANLASGQFPKTPENAWLTKDGRLRRIAWTNTALTDPLGQVTQVIASGIDITERMEAEATRRESEERFRSLFDTMNLGVIYQDASGKITDINPAAECLLALSREQILGQQCLNPPWLCLNSLGETLHHDDLPSCIALRSGKPVRDFLLSLTPPDGSRPRWLMANSIPQFRADSSVPYQVFTTLTDVSLLKSTEESLSRSERRFRDLVESSSDWIWEVNAQGKYTYSSPQTLEILGRTPEELLGKTPFDLMPDWEAERVSGLFEKIASRKSAFSMLENVNLHRDGHEVVMETSAIPILDNQGQLLGYRGIDRDVTERKAAEEQLHRNNLELERLHAAQLAEQELASAIMDHMARRHMLDDPAIRHWQQASSRFNGDVLGLSRSPTGRLYVMLADATGHGLPAAVCLLPAITVFYGMAKRDMPLKEMVEEINRQLRATLPTGYFLSAGLFIFDGNERSMEWWLGGMPPVLVFGPGGRLEKQLHSSNLPLGIEEMTRVDTHVDAFQCNGERQYLLYTDGLVEAANAAGEEFGQERLIDACRGEGEEDWISSIQSSLTGHLNGQSVTDDLSLVLIACRTACDETRCPVRRSREAAVSP